jgi:hypothetical protein
MILMWFISDCSVFMLRKLCIKMWNYFQFFSSHFINILVSNTFHLVSATKHLEDMVRPQDSKT